VTVATAHPIHVTWNAGTRPSTGFWTTTANEYANAATMQRATPRPDREPEPAVAAPISATPPNATVHPAKRPGGKPSRRNTPAKIAIRIGPVFTSIAAVPASTRCSAAFSTTL
jgi:hypothetical protein